MTENEAEPEPEPTRPEFIEESRSLTEAAIVATPVAVLLQPVVAAFANEYIGKDEQPNDPPPQQTPKED
jgi:hypothetical protein